VEGRPLQQTRTSGIQNARLEEKKEILVKQLKTCEKNM
jgi:hypothetical protein